MPTSTLTSKGQITLPKVVRDHLALAAGDEVDFMIAEDGTVTVASCHRSAAELFGFLSRTRQQSAPDVAAMDEALEESLAEDDRRVRGST